jgi:hypothetical protein
MKWAAPTFALALLVAGLVWWLDPSHVAEREARAAATAARIALAAEREAQLAPLYTVLTGGAYVLLFLGAAGAVAYALALGALDLRRRATTTMPTRDGRLPVPLPQLPAASVAALGATHARLQLAAGEQPLLAALTFDAELVGLLEAPAE